MSKQFWAMVTSSINVIGVKEEDNDYYQRMSLPGEVLDDNPSKIPANNLDGKLIKTLNQKNSSRRQVHHKEGTLFFDDRKRPIDFILVYEDGSSEEHYQREMFQRNLIDEGLELEVEDKMDSMCQDSYFVKIHAPYDVLSRYLDILKLKQQTRKEIPSQWSISGLFAWLGMKNPFMYNEELIPPEPRILPTSFSNLNQNGCPTTVVQQIQIRSANGPKKEEKTSSLASLLRQDSQSEILTLPDPELEWFLMKERDAHISHEQRNIIVWEILNRAKFTHATYDYGINKLLKGQVYLAAYPLHDGPYEKDIPGQPRCNRRILYLEWARFTKWYKFQPLELIHQYFGNKMALYFAWLGFYTTMLIPAAILGIFTFIYGLAYMNTDSNKSSAAICEEEAAGNITMCPLCDKDCDFWKLEETCSDSKIAFLFDNTMTVVFAVGMSFWASMFLEMWKRRQAILQWHWDMENVDDGEDVRPEYEEKVKVDESKTDVNHSFLPAWNKCGRYISANSMVLFLILLVLAAFTGVLIYQFIVEVVMHKSEDHHEQEHAKLVASISAAFLNLFVIMILNYFYGKVVEHLTAFEMPRTEKEFEDSLILKVVCFHFVNYYTPLIYVAFFKGKFFHYPGDTSTKGNIFIQLRHDMCEAAGCVFDLCVHLAVIMLGEPIISNSIELFVPMFKVWWNKRLNNQKGQQIYTIWEKDYDLTEYTRMSVFDEYLEMVIQYGFVTLFVAAFPLAPFFALLNNIVEIRLDAFKYLTQTRRPLPQRVKDIGILEDILKAITYAAVLANALVISVTSEFIPRLVYISSYSEHNKLDGYVVNSLAAFNVSDYEEGIGPDPHRYPKKDWPSICYYRAYRHPPGSKNAYELNVQFWHVFTARLAFIIFFEHFVFISTGFISWMIPDVPYEVKHQITTERKMKENALSEVQKEKIKEEREKLRDVNHIDALVREQDPGAAAARKYQNNNSASRPGSLR